HSVLSMFAPRVIEHLDIIEHILPRLYTCFVGPAPYSLTFEQIEEALGDSVVVTVSPPAHRVLQIVCPEERRPVHAGKLGALIRVDQHLALWFAAPHGHEQCLQDHICCLAAL